GPGPATPGVNASGRDILKALGDPVSLGVLAALSRNGRDVHSVVLETGLPQSSVYRKLHELTSLGLVGVDRFAFTSEGRKVELFGLRMRAIYVEVARGQVRVEVVSRRDSSDNVHAMWDEVRRRS
ncbi:MAG: helix-turn-helix domain-containing protein, partial [Thermoplasmata archaeon]|nr:helix-turn-helix domain-containing protein [Thermoplasmata archaeon]